MSEWIRHRGSKSMPKRLEGKYYEAMRRDGTIAAFVNSWLHCGRDSDVLKYRITGNIAPPDHSKGFPVGTTAKDIGAKVGDEFVSLIDYVSFKKGDIIKLAEDDESDMPYFSKDGSMEISGFHCMRFSELAPIPPKTAIELQAEEVGIPEPVQLVDADGWIKWNGGECPVAYDAIAEVKFRNGHTNTNPADVWRWEDRTGSWSIIAYRIHQEWPEDRVDVVGQNGNDGLHYDDTHLGIKRPDGDGWVKYNAGDVVDLNGVHHVSFYTTEGGFGRLAPVIDKWHPRSNVAWYRLNYETGTAHVTPAAVNVMVDLGIKEPTTAPDFLQSAINTLTQRGKDYDKPEGERSAAAVAVAFNAITGRNLTEAEVWLILQLVKDVRQWQNPGRYHADSALDCVAYAALKAEALANNKEGK